MLPILQSIFFFIVSFLVGRSVLKLTRIEAQELMPVISSVIGIVVTTSLLFFSGFIVPFTQFSVLLVLVGLCMLSLLMLQKTLIQIPAELKLFITHEFRSAVFIWIFLVVFIVWLFGRALFYGPQGELIAGDRLVWVDWPVHMTIISNFAWGQNFPPQNPTFAGISLIYPFMADFLSGVFLALGAQMPFALALPSIILILLFCALFLKLFSTQFQQLNHSMESYKWAFVSLIASLFWGGVGWVYWIGEVIGSADPFETLFFPPREYTFWHEKGLWFFTFFFSEILPQRAFLFGLPMFFLVLWFIISNLSQHSRRQYVLAGVIAGIMPFFHTHSFMSLWFLMGTWFVLSIRESIYSIKRRQMYMHLWIWFGVPFFLLSLIHLPLFRGHATQIPFEFGWMKQQENFFWFWFKNTGLFIPLWLYGWWKAKFSRETKILGLASWSLFLLPNFFRFAAWGYDNLKIMTYWYLLGSLFATAGLYTLWMQKRWWSRGLASLLFASLIFSGLLEFVRVVQTPNVQITLWSREDQQMAIDIRSKTPPDAVFLTAAIHDHPVSNLSGRKIIIGFPGNSWSWGIEGWDRREQDVRMMYRGEPQAQALWKQYSIDYIMVSDRERWFEKGLDEEYIAENTELILERGNTRVYKVN